MSKKWAEFLLIIACVAQFFCGAASVTAASRMMFAFSRDGAVPGGRFWRRVSTRTRVPVYAVCAIAVLAWALMLPTLANGAIGYLVGTSNAVIGLYIAYGVPIYLRWRAGDSFEPGAWTLGRHYKWINPLAVAWIILIVILFLMPTVPTAIPWHSGFDWNVVNYAPITVGGVLVLVGIWWMVSARKWFKGPVREGTDDELARIEAGFTTAPAGTQPA
jgi:amino acid transporter